MKEYLARMKRPETKQLYSKRCEIAEFPHLWAKGVKKWKRFSVRGILKAGMEAMWVAIAYNVAQWMRIDAAQAALDCADISPRRTSSLLLRSTKPSEVTRYS